MAGRIRSVKPEWLEDERLAHASLAARVLSIGLMLIADDHGRGRGHPVDVGAAVFKAEPNPREIAATALAELETIEFIVTYTVRGQTYFAIRNWAKHQRVDKPGAPRVPRPDEADAPPISSGKTSINSQIRETPANVREGVGNFREDAGSASGGVGSDAGRAASTHIGTTATVSATDAAQTSAQTKIRETLAKVPGNLATDLRSPISISDHDHDHSNNNSAGARPWSVGWCTAEMLAAAADDPLFADGDFDAATETFRTIAKKLAALPDEMRFADLRAEASAWFVHARNEAASAADAGRPWGQRRTLGEVESKATTRLKFRAKDARIERERSRDTANRPARRFEPDGDDLDLDDDRLFPRVARSGP